MQQKSENPAMRYEKGRKSASRDRIMEVAAECFRSDGIAASGLATIMSKAGLTNGAFYPHFASKAELVRETVVAAMDVQAGLLRDAMASGGPERAIAVYLSAEHRDNPGKGCASAALVPEIARQSPETREVYTNQVMSLMRTISGELPQGKDAEGVALAVYALLIGTLQLARAVEGRELSDRILAAGKDAARTLIQSQQKSVVSTGA
jgi:TetR/AcrR family transcriptional regulator, transcriptional repressor for nem operon